MKWEELLILAGTVLVMFSFIRRRAGGGKAPEFLTEVMVFWTGIWMIILGGLAP